MMLVWQKRKRFHGFLRPWWLVINILLLLPWNVVKSNDEQTNECSIDGNFCDATSKRGELLGKEGEGSHQNQQHPLMEDSSQAAEEEEDDDDDDSLSLTSSSSSSQQSQQQQQTHHLQQQQPTRKRGSTTKGFPCEDQNEKCSQWANRGKCISHASYMNRFCRRSCELCEDQQDLSTDPIQRFQQLLQGGDMGIIQQYTHDQWTHNHTDNDNNSDNDQKKKNNNILSTKEQVQERILEARTYLETKVYGMMDDRTIELCKNKSELCAIWAILGHCETNAKCMCLLVGWLLVPRIQYLLLATLVLLCGRFFFFCITNMELFLVASVFWGVFGGNVCVCVFWWGEKIVMKKNCAPVCFSCDYVTIEGRCPLDPTAPNAWGPGDLNRMFTKLTTTTTTTTTEGPYRSNHSITILSSPTSTQNGGGGPWVITIEDLLTEQESQRMIELGTQEGYQRSADVGYVRPDGSYEKSIHVGRTSENAWCQKDCVRDPVTQQIMARISDLIDIPETNSEHLQLLKYEEGQYYHVHHDYIDYHTRRQHGVRILTVFLYLNDVEAGGGTNFDQLNITVLPKRGRALLWPSVLNDHPDDKDPRMTHQALPVERGIKYAANAWFHMRDFKTANENGCT